MQQDNKIIINIPAGGFYVHDKQNLNIIPYSDGAFGCCYLTIEDSLSQKILIAHINAQTVMFEPIAEKTVKLMLDEFEKQKADIKKSKITIFHTNKFEEYEKAQAEKTENFRLTNGYKEKTSNNMVAEPFANEFLQEALKKGLKNREIENDIAMNGEFNSNLSEFIKNPMIGNKKTDICFIDGKVYLQNSHKNQCPSKEEWQKPEQERDWSKWKSSIEEKTEGAEKIFKTIEEMQDDSSIKKIYGANNSTGEFYLTLKEGIESKQIGQDDIEFNFSKNASEEFKKRMIWH
jgi:hypothetical protein